MEVLPDKGTVLADTAERAEEVDISRAEAARQRAEDLMQRHPEDKTDYERAEAALRRSSLRLKVAGRRRKRGLAAPPPTEFK
jgi:F-type H+-transporting ATPase subunit epsilon